MEFHMQPYCCPMKKLDSSFFVCSVCMAIYCEDCKQEMRECRKCSYHFDKDEPSREVDVEAQINLMDEREAKSKKAADDRVDLN